MLEDLAGLYLAGCRRLVLIRTDVPVEGATLLDPTAAKDFNALLVSRGFEPLVLRLAGPESKSAGLLRRHARETARVARRRRFFNPPVEAEPEEAAASALSRLQADGADQAGALFAAAPQIDPGRCTGCDACLRVCPAQVLTHVNDSAGEGSYTVHPAGCDACGLCVEMCTHSAIGLEYMTRRPDRTALTDWTCPACWVPVHAPMGHAADGGLCHICRLSGHHKKLYQVLP